VSTPAYAYGQALGTMQRAYTRMAQEVVAGFRDALAGQRRPLTAEDLERLADARYRANIDLTRRAVRRNVKAQFNQLRRDLGLPRD
jgi:hypothetical protein